LGFFLLLLRLLRLLRRLHPLPFLGFPFLLGLPLLLLLLPHPLLLLLLLLLLLQALLPLLLLGLYLLFLPLLEHPLLQHVLFLHRRPQDGLGEAVGRSHRQQQRQDHGRQGNSAVVHFPPPSSSLKRGSVFLIGKVIISI
jgi:hypothetical protein